MGRNVVIRRAGASDAEQILKLQYLCYQSEAQLYDDWTLPPLTQTLDSLRAEYETHVILVAALGEEVIGSVRADVEQGVCRIGRLIVHPRLQGHGLGSRLMRAIEAEFPDAAEYELYTGHRSAENLRLYRRLGYRDSRIEALNPRVKLVYLAKAAA